MGKVVQVMLYSISLYAIVVGAINIFAPSLPYIDNTIFGVLAVCYGILVAQYTRLHARNKAMKEAFDTALIDDLERIKRG